MLEGYEIDCGIIKQILLTGRVRYDLDYIRARYDSYPTTRAMSQLRFRLLEEMNAPEEVWPASETVL